MIYGELTSARHYAKRRKTWGNSFINGVRVLDRLGTQLITLTPL